MYHRTTYSSQQQATRTMDDLKSPKTTTAWTNPMAHNTTATLPLGTMQLSVNAGNDCKRTCRVGPAEWDHTGTRCLTPHNDKLLLRPVFSLLCLLITASAIFFFFTREGREGKGKRKGKTKKEKYCETASGWHSGSIPEEARVNTEDNCSIDAICSWGPSRRSDRGKTAILTGRS